MDVTPEMVLLILVVATALAFDFTNGFHDTANAMATSIATHALSPRVAVLLCAVLNLVGAFLSVEVALTVTNAIIRIQNPDGTPRTDLVADGGHGLLLVLLAGLAGAITWNLLTWLRGLPSSSSHAMFGGLIGATIAGLGPDAVKWVGEGSKLDGVVGKIIIPGLLSPVIAALVATVGTWLVFRIARGVADKAMDSGFRWGQIGTASLVSLAHGANDAQKTMGVITLALVAHGDISSSSFAVPSWVVLCSACAISLGTFTGGWRIINTLGSRIIKMDPAQGFAAQGAGSAVILAASTVGYPLSTTHVISGGIMGAGAAKSLSAVRWGVAGNIVIAWILTLPAAAVIGAAVYGITAAFGTGAAGPVLVSLGLAGACALILARRVQQTAPAPSPS